MNASFEEQFEQLTGHAPFPWQVRLYERFQAGQIPTRCNIPTGLGKTMVIPIWLLALGNGENRNIPRRLVYVVNRRTIVDQSTTLVMTVREKLASAENDSTSPLFSIVQALRKINPLDSQEASPLAISTLRGELADNQEWKFNPAQAGIVIGTVDMVGSKLLFSGYGDTRRTRSLHAGLLGCDTLFVHDEAHLTPAFGKLLHSVKRLREPDNGEANSVPPMHVLELSATLDADAFTDSSVELDKSDRSNSTIQKRISAVKNMRLHDVEKPGKLVQDKILELALEHESQVCRVVVFVRKPDDAQKIASNLQSKLGEKAVEDWKGAHAEEKLPKARESGLKKRAAEKVSLLTGRIRGRERDMLLQREGMQPFLGKCDAEETLYFVATSAAEVGMDLHADHMVCDLSTLDSMIQRLGRVNRFGQTAGQVAVVIESKIDETKESARFSMKQFLETKHQIENGIDVSLSAVKGWLEDKEAFSAWPEKPEMVELTDILMDLFSMTSAESISARPEPESWLHGIQEDYPHTVFAWREEVELLACCDPREIQQWFRAHPLGAAERVQLPTHVITKTDRKSSLLKELAEAKQLSDEERQTRRELPVIVLSAEGNATIVKLGELIDAPSGVSLRYAAVVFPAAVGGLSADGFFDPKTKSINKHVDVGDLKDSSILRGVVDRTGNSWTFETLLASPETIAGQWSNLSTAIRTIENQTERKVALKLQTQLASEEQDEDELTEKWLVLLKKQPKKNYSAGTLPTVSQHNDAVAELARTLGESLGLPEAMCEVLALAGKHHDDGKAHACWQVAAGHDPANQTEPLAKGKGAVNWRKLGGYRHEADSLMRTRAIKEIQNHPHHDLILHLIAMHHGWARPWFREEAFPPDEPAETARKETREAMLRFERLQREYGWWALAWLEALFKRADGIVSAGGDINPDMEDES